MYKLRRSLSIAVLLILLSSLFVLSCQKNVDSSGAKSSDEIRLKNGTISDRKFNSNTQPTSNLTEAEKQQLIQEYGLVTIHVDSLPANFTPKVVNSLQEAKDFFDYGLSVAYNVSDVNQTMFIDWNANNSLTASSTTTSKKKLSKRKIIGSNIAMWEPDPDCPGAWWSHQTGFLWSNNMRFEWRTNHILNGSTWNVSGVLVEPTAPFPGIGYRQSGSVKDFSTSTTIDFCVDGKVFIGIDVAGLNLSIPVDHYYRITHDPCTGSGRIREGHGRCL